MLADFLNAKEKVNQVLIDYFEQRKSAYYGSIRIPKRIIHEGSKYFLTYQDGTKKETLLSKIESSMSYNVSDLLNDSLNSYKIFFLL